MTISERLEKAIEVELVKQKELEEQQQEEGKEQGDQSWRKPRLPLRVNIVANKGQEDAKKNYQKIKDYLKELDYFFDCGEFAFHNKSFDASMKPEDILDLDKQDFVDTIRYNYERLS